MRERRAQHPFTTLISANDLSKHLEDPAWAFFDCRFDLEDPDAGEIAYRKGHIPGAVYVHLERDLSAPQTGMNGRHPLPTTDQLAETFSRLGIHDGLQVVAYDDDGGMYAARLWWSLRYMGHLQAAVLDGGLTAWLDEELPTESGSKATEAAQFFPRRIEDLHVTLEELEEARADEEPTLVDAREPDRYRGDSEPIDPVAGRIPGALNFYWKDALDAEGRFHPPEALGEMFDELLERRAGSQTIAYCGSGVSACHLILAMEHAGIEGVKLYSGSWSEWSSDPSRPIATG